MLLLPFLGSELAAETFLRSTVGLDSVIGDVRYVRVQSSETLIDLARRFDLGYDELIKANPEVNRWTPESSSIVTLPHRHVLPDVSPEGVVINLAELRLYRFITTKDPQQVVVTFPVSIGRMDWKTPLGRTSVIKKQPNPAWYPPASIREEHARIGESLPEMIPGGDAENPLGKFALYLGMPGYLIHGTDERKASGIGMRVTHGCVRLYPEDIEKLYRQVELGTPVTFVDQPIKVGWQNADLFLEVHAPLDEDQLPIKPSVEEAIERVLDKLAEAQLDGTDLGNMAVIDRDQIARVTERADGVPVAVFTTPNLLPPAKRKRTIAR